MQPAQATAWDEFLRFYNQKNKDRKTRVGVFEGGDDFWIKSDLPLSGIDIDPQPNGIGVSIILGPYPHVIHSAFVDGPVQP